jgi:hypothetical protein
MPSFFFPFFFGLKPTALSNNHHVRRHSLSVRGAPFCNSDLCSNNDWASFHRSMSLVYFSVQPVPTKPQSVGATFIFWLCPSLAPEPRIHRYIASTPVHHSHSHHHHPHHTVHHRYRGSTGSDICFAPSASPTESPDPTTPNKDAKTCDSESLSDGEDMGLKAQATGDL